MNAFKSYESFEEGLADLCSISTNIDEIMSLHGDLPTTSNDAVLVLMERIKNDIPSIFSESYPASSAFSVTAYEVGYKCPGQLSFGWRISPIKDTVIYKFRITLASNSVIAKNTDLMKKAKALGFVLRDIEKKD